MERLLSMKHGKDGERFYARKWYDESGGRSHYQAAMAAFVGQSAFFSVAVVVRLFDKEQLWVAGFSAVALITSMVGTVMLLYRTGALCDIF
mmetsp:Transcript_36618/g.101679  ORF Transcript_36618/g.101679 Transcript_36618/m.101679 type:complete len:91 (-) Transcript_36618:52-324(-)